MRVIVPFATVIAGIGVAATSCEAYDEALAQPSGEGGANDATSSDGAYDAEMDVNIDDAGDAADVMTDSEARADGPGGSPYAPCAFSSPAHFCEAPANGTLSPGSCDGATTGQCCRCTCPTTMTVTSCTTSGNGCSSLSPPCPSN